jgi:hypothetical protein
LTKEVRGQKKTSIHFRIREINLLLEMQFPKGGENPMKIKTRIHAGGRCDPTAGGGGIVKQPAPVVQQ